MEKCRSMVTTVTWKCNQVTNTHKIKGAAREGKSAMGRKGNINKGTGRQGNINKGTEDKRGHGAETQKGSRKGLEENNKENKKSHDVSRNM